MFDIKLYNSYRVKCPAKESVWYLIWICTVCLSMNMTSGLDELNDACLPLGFFSHRDI